MTTDFSPSTAWRRLHGTALVLLAIAGMSLAGVRPALAQDEATLKTVLASHATAHGGLEAWKQVKSFKVEGVFEAFSVESPFVTYHLRPNLYHFEHSVLGAPTVLAFDGSHPWVRSAAYGAPQGRVISEDAGRNVSEDAVFGCALLSHQVNEVPIELLGLTRFEGREYWEVKARPADGNVETWLLDKETGLEFRRLNQTFDVFSGNIDMEMETYFLDFRQVGEILLAFRDERHFGTRYRVRQAESVKVNPSVDRDMFTAPASPAEEKGESSGR
jgi:hypothetical protein